MSTTKNNSSTRNVPILDNITKLLNIHIRKEREKHFRLGIPFSSESILFSSTSCAYLEASNVRKRLTRLYDRIGIEATTFHALRHTFCTLLAEMGVPLKNASVLMGHSDIAVTAKVYTHVDDNEKKKSIEKLSALFN